MQLTKLNLENFRQHKDQTLFFSPGVNVIRGQNEAGKTTILEAIGYALYGSKACRNSDVKSWGSTAPAKVIAEFEGGDGFLVYRSKAGSEVRQNETLVSGQTETTTKVTEILGVNLEQARALILATQDDVRGALSRGATATNNLVEELANLNLIDKLLDTTPQPDLNYLTKQKEASETALSTTQQELKEHQENEPEATNMEDADKVRDQMVRQISENTNKLLESASTLQTWEQRKAELDKLSLEVESGRKLVAKLQQQQSETPDKVKNFEAVTAHQALEELKRRQLLRDRLTLQTKRDALIKGCITEAQAAHQQLVKSINSATEEFAQLREELARIQAGIGEGSCTFCGLDISALPPILTLKAREQQLHKSLSELSETIKNLRLEETAQRNSLTQWSNLDKEITFMGDISTVFMYLEEEAEQVIAEATELEAQHKTYLKCVREKEIAEALLATKQKNLSQPVPTVEEIQAAKLVVSELKARLETQNSDLLAYTTKMNEATLLRARWEGQQKTLSDIVKVHTEAANWWKAETEKAVDQKDFISWLRAVKPLIAGKIWSQVLYAASTYATALRQEPTSITREGKEFQVNGKSLDSYSGSALDMLGLAVRCALIKTFCPRSDFLLLDEPFAACDLQRQQVAFAFLTSLGFSQIILVTHDEASEQLAQNLITLGV